MSNRLDALMAREYKSGGETKTAFTKIGAAFETKSGGWSVILDAVPAPVEGQFKILLMQPKPKDEQPRQRTQQSPNRDDPRTSYAQDLDDEIPF